MFRSPTFTLVTEIVAVLATCFGPMVAALGDLARHSF